MLPQQAVMWHCGQACRRQPDYRNCRSFYNLPKSGLATDFGSTEIYQPKTCMSHDELDKEHHTNSLKQSGPWVNKHEEGQHLPIGRCKGYNCLRTLFWNGRSLHPIDH